MVDTALLRELDAVADHLTVLAVARPDGSISASLVKAGVLVDPVTDALSIGVVVAGSAVKLGLLRSSGRATMVYTRGHRWVAAEGAVRLHGPDDPSDPPTDRPLSSILRLVYQSAGGTHDDWREFDRAMEEDRRCAVFVRTSRITGNA